MKNLGTLLLSVSLLFVFFPIFNNSSTSEKLLPQITSKNIQHGIHVPWALPGKRVMEPNAAPIEWAGEWPSVPFNTIRIWDTRTAWAQIHPQRDVLYWEVLDAYIEKISSNNVEDIVFVISGTPQWAATNQALGSAEWIGENSASPPDLEAWELFVSQLVERYKGKITAYEIWNEPNVDLFWQGTNEQLVELISVASRIIKEKDPEAVVVAPALLIRNYAGARSASELWRDLRLHDWGGVDVVSTHIYPTFVPTESTIFSRRSAESKLGTILYIIDSELKKLGWDKEHWVTETSFVGPRKIHDTTAEKLVYSSTKNILRYADRVYWYAWGTEDAGYKSALIFDENSGAARGYHSAQK